MGDYQVNPETERLLNPSPPSSTVRQGNYSPPGEYQNHKYPSAKDEGHEETRTYIRRFYILLLFSLLGFVQGGVWNTWGPVAQSSEKSFGWHDQDIALLANWGPITYVVSIVFFTYLMDVKGLRWACLVTAVLVTAGCGLRCITPDQPYVTWLMHAGQLLNGLGGPVAMGGPPLVSSVWFPVHERTTATGFGAIISSIGTAVSFIIGPIIVPSPLCLNGTSPNGKNNTTLCNQLEKKKNITVVNIPEMKAKIMHLMYGEFALSAAILLLMLLYFPSKPPKPPSISASIQRTSYKKGLAALLRKKEFWLLGTPYALASGVSACWGSVFDIIVAPFGISEITAGWMCFYAVVIGSGAALVVARVADIIAKRMKLFLILCYVGAVLAFGWFTFICQRIFPMFTAGLYIGLIVGSTCLSSAIPLYYELVCESCYPIAEGVTNGFLTLLNNVAGLLFLLVLMLKQYIGTLWMNWCLVGCIIVCIPILMMFKERYQRFDIDTNVKEREDHDQEDVSYPPPTVDHSIN